METKSRLTDANNDLEELPSIFLAHCFGCFIIQASICILICISIV